MKKFTKRALLATAVVLAFSTTSFAANMIDKCEVIGKKGETPITAPAKAGQLTLETNLPAPIWWMCGRRPTATICSR